MKNLNISSKGISIYTYQIFQIFKQNLISTYGQSFLWFLWIFIIPTSKMLLFVFLKETKVIEGNTAYLAYPLYVFFSLILWQIFVHITTNSCSILSRYNNLSTLNFPRALLIYGNASVSLFNAFLQLFLLIFVSLLCKTPPSIGIICIPVVFFFIVLFAIGMAKIIVILSSVSRDISEGFVVLLMFWMFATPAIYSKSSGYANFIDYINPLNVFIKTAHGLWLGDFSKITMVFYLHCGIAVLIFCLGSYFFTKCIYIALERI